jgi:hypothetical protein
LALTELTRRERSSGLARKSRRSHAASHTVVADDMSSDEGEEELGFRDGGDNPVWVQSLWVYPIKSCAGVRVSSASLTRFGLRHDRRWLIVRQQHSGVREVTCVFTCACVCVEPVVVTCVCVCVCMSLLLTTHRDATSGSCLRSARNPKWRNCSLT